MEVMWIETLVSFDGSTQCANRKSKKHYCKCESSRFTITHWAWDKNVCEEFERIYILDLPYRTGSGVK